MRIVRLVAVTVAATLILILGVAVNCARAASRRRTDGGALEGVASLMTDNATEYRSSHRACDGTALGVWASGFGTVTEGKYT